VVGQVKVVAQGMEVKVGVGLAMVVRGVEEKQGPEEGRGEVGVQEEVRVVAWGAAS
jgi:hypothetical protein